MHSRSADNKIQIIRDILCSMTDMDLDTLFGQHLRIDALMHIRAGNNQPRVMQHLGKRRHADAADTDQQTLFPGNQVFFEI